MPNNELFYRVAREALADAAAASSFHHRRLVTTAIRGLVDDLDAAIESYLVECDEEGMTPAVREEIKHGYQHAVALADSLRAWATIDCREGEVNAKQ